MYAAKSAWASIFLTAYLTEDTVQKQEGRSRNHVQRKEQACSESAVPMGSRGYSSSGLCLAAAGTNHRPTPGKTTSEPYDRNRQRLAWGANRSAREPESRIVHR